MDYTKQLKSDLLKSWDDCPPERDDAYHQAERQHRRIQKVYHADI